MPLTKNPTMKDLRADLERVRRYVEEPKPAGLYSIRMALADFGKLLDNIQDAYDANDLTDPSCSSAADDASTLYDFLTGLGYKVP